MTVSGSVSQWKCCSHPSQNIGKYLAVFNLTRVVVSNSQQRSAHRQTSHNDDFEPLINPYPQAELREAHAE